MGSQGGELPYVDVSLWWFVQTALPQVSLTPGHDFETAAVYLEEEGAQEERDSCCEGEKDYRVAFALLG
ncbi:hypothetical protein AAHA92_04685 [Salvia divinorum]|uniref:Uncharacterized protein n=1 Tax=Salvia divinorum TaxID=28513 RepID=A0ABD1I013_SALDI